MLADTTWRPLVNDPNLWAWTIVVAYLSACALCVAAARRERSEWAPWDFRSQFFWPAMAALMLALGVNKQLDLQTLLTQYLRSWARSEGWYGDRRAYQEIFIGCCAWMGLVAVLAGFCMIQGRWRRYGLAYVGSIFLMTFVAIRAASFHHVDVILYQLPYIGNRVNAILELSGSVLISVGAWRAWSAPPHQAELASPAD